MKNNYLFRNLIFLVGFTLFGINSYAQNVTGTVSDANGPLPGVNVIAQGTSNGVTTDFNGNYTIENVASDAVLQFSYLGFISQDIKVEGRSNINITLLESANELDEIVLVGYTSRARGEITGSIVSVDMDEASKVPFVNAAEALQGRVSGVNVIASSRPGAAPVINIRGLGSTNATGPLFIIDGVQTTDALIFNRINPADIEQMNVLKDGAASIYGARAANGVVIVTTKGGSYNMGRTALSLDIYTGVSVVGNTPDLLNAEQLSQARFNAFINDGSPDPVHPQYRPNSSYTWGVQDFLIDPSTALPKTDPSVRVSTPNGTNWFNEITQTAPTTNISLSLASGNENSKSYFSVGYLTRDAVVVYNGFKRVNIQLNNEFKLGKKVKIGQHLNTNFSRSSGNSNQTGELAIRMNPLIPVRDENGAYAGSYSNSYGLSVGENPVARAYRDRNDYLKNFGLFGDAYLSYDILDGLTFKTTIAGAMNALDQRDFTALNPEHSEPLTVNLLRERDSNSYSWVFTNMVTYTKAFGSHTINAFAAMEAVENWSKGKNISRTDYFNESPNFYLLNNGFGDPFVGNTWENKNSIFSIFGSVDYNFDNRYFVTATLRHDTSSRFAGDNKSRVFPAISLGWSIDKEGFFPEGALVNSLRMKASWGELGNQQLPINNPTLSLFNFNENTANYAFNPGAISAGAVLNQIGNPNLNWEISETTNIGVDFGMFDSRLFGSLELWQIKTNGLIVLNNQLISTTAPDAGAPYVNIGDVKNTGVDFSLGWNDTTDGGLTYGINANFSHYRNEVVNLINGTPVAGDRTTSWAGGYTRTEEGEPMSYFFGMNIVGFDDNGRWVYEDVNGDGVVNDEDRTKIGSPHPDFVYGINLNAAYKGFDFSAFFNGSQGNDIIDFNRIFTDFPLFVDNNRSTRVLDSWTPNNTNATLPALSGSLNGVEINSNSYFVQDGSYLRLRNLQIGYSLSKDLTDKLKIANLRIYLQGTNLFTITGYEGIDPEVLPIDNLNQGIDRRTFPIAKIYTIGINLKF
ncbi:MAG: TonB-dependent receptor [Flavobacteriaceae bacterium]|nr:TonB-dependent receptor [Flavobacteriaceae bacterium]